MGRWLAEAPQPVHRGIKTRTRPGGRQGVQEGELLPTFQLVPLQVEVLQVLQAVQPRAQPPPQRHRTALAGEPAAAAGWWWGERGAGEGGARQVASKAARGAHDGIVHALQPRRARRAASGAAPPHSQGGDEVAGVHVVPVTPAAGQHASRAAVSSCPTVLQAAWRDAHSTLQVFTSSFKRSAAPAKRTDPPCSCDGGVLNACSCCRRFHSCGRPPTPPHRPACALGTRPSISTHSTPPHVHKGAEQSSSPPAAVHQPLRPHAACTSSKFSIPSRNAINSSFSAAGRSGEGRPGCGVAWRRRRGKQR